MLRVRRMVRPGIPDEREYPAEFVKAAIASFLELGENPDSYEDSETLALTLETPKGKLVADTFNKGYYNSLICDLENGDSSRALLQLEIPEEEYDSIQENWKAPVPKSTPRIYLYRDGDNVSHIIALDEEYEHIRMACELGETRPEWFLCP